MPDPSINQTFTVAVADAGCLLDVTLLRKINDPIPKGKSGLELGVQLNFGD